MKILETEQNRTGSKSLLIYASLKKVKTFWLLVLLELDLKAVVRALIQYLISDFKTAPNSNVVSNV